MSGKWAGLNDNASCPFFNSEQLRGILVGSSDSAETDRVLEHLDGCERCQRLADEILQTIDGESVRQSTESARDFISLESSDRERACQILGNALGSFTWKSASGRDMPGRIGGHYEVIRMLDRGGMSEVFECQDLRLGRRVAIKVLREVSVDSNLLERLRREATIQAGLNHPHIVAIHEVEFESYPPFLVMELMKGGTLKAAVRQTLPGPKTAALIVARLARALEAAHEQGVIHRDIKPSNVLLAEPFDADRGRLDDAVVKLADFGLARQTDSQTGLTRSEVLAGTPAYMSPEQTAGNSDRLTAQSDIYSLGVLLYELITGRPPLLTDNLELTLAMIREVTPVEPRQLQPNVSKDLNTICMKCLEKEPRARYATAADLAADLESYLEGRGIQARPVGPVVRLARWCRRNRSLAAWMAVALISLSSLAVGGLGFAVSQARLRETAQQETLRALDAEKVARAAQTQAENMESKAAAALKDAENSRQQAQNESDLSRSYFFASMRALDETARKIGMARKAENPAAAVDPIEAEIRKVSDTILSGFSKWPEALYGKEADPLEKLSAIQLERLFRDASALRDLSRVDQYKELMNEIIELFAKTPVGHPDYDSRLMLDLKCRANMGQDLENEGKPDEAIRLLQPAWDRLVGSIERYRENRQMIVTFFSASMRLNELLQKAGRKREADEINLRVRPIYGIYYGIAREGETRQPFTGNIPEMPIPEMP